MAKFIIGCFLFLIFPLSSFATLGFTPESPQLINTEVTIDCSEGNEALFIPQTSGDNFEENCSSGTQTFTSSIAQDIVIKECTVAILPNTCTGEISESTYTFTDPEPPTPTATTTVIIENIGNITFGLGIIIFLMSIALTAYIYNSITPKKPWKK